MQRSPCGTGHGPDRDDGDTAGMDRDADGRARNARPRDVLGRPLARTAAGQQPVADDAALPPAQALAAAQDLLDAGQPFHAHEVLEAAWKAAPPAERDLWQGLAQIAVGLTHALRGNARGAVALLRRGADRLAGYPAPGPARRRRRRPAAARAATLADRIEASRPGRARPGRTLRITPARHAAGQRRLAALAAPGWTPRSWRCRQPPRRWRPLRPSARSRCRNGSRGREHNAVDLAAPATAADRPSYRARSAPGSGRSAGARPPSGRCSGRRPSRCGRSGRPATVSGWSSGYPATMALVPSAACGANCSGGAVRPGTSMTARSRCGS